jgi:hypothetical protein
MRPKKSIKTQIEFPGIIKGQDNCRGKELSYNHGGDVGRGRGINLSCKTTVIEV